MILTCSTDLLRRSVDRRRCSDPRLQMRIQMPPRPQISLRSRKTLIRQSAEINWLSGEREGTKTFLSKLTVQSRYRAERLRFVVKNKNTFRTIQATFVYRLERYQIIICATLEKEIDKTYITYCYFYWRSSPLNTYFHVRL